MSFEAGPFEWWTDDDGHLWVRHQCITDQKQTATRLPAPWRVEGDGVVPSLHCTRCEAHLFVGAAERVESLWNWMIDVREVCGPCDGKDAPVPDCEYCHGTGRQDLTPHPAA